MRWNEFMDGNDRVKQNLNKLFKDLESEHPSKKIAVFDADGTLWRSDIGDQFFKYQIKNKLAPGISGIDDPWAQYINRLRDDQLGAYGWLAQINSGLSEDELRAQAHEFFKSEFSSQLDATMKNLVQQLKSRQFQVWICSASIKWVIEPAAQSLGIERIIGLEVEVQDGKLTDKLVEPLTYGAGKTSALKTKLPEAPCFVAGNSIGDLDMMSMATHMPLVVRFEPYRDFTLEEENALAEEAKNRNWNIQTVSFA